MSHKLGKHQTKKEHTYVNFIKQNLKIVISMWLIGLVRENLTIYLAKKYVPHSVHSKVTKTCAKRRQIKMNRIKKSQKNTKRKVSVKMS